MTLFCSIDSGAKKKPVSGLLDAVMTGNLPGSDGEEPGPGIPMAEVISPPGSEGLHERLSHDVLSSLLPQPSVGIAMQHLGMALVQQPEPRRIHQRPLDDLSVGALFRSRPGAMDASLRVDHLQPRLPNFCSTFHLCFEQLMGSLARGLKPQRYPFVMITMRNFAFREKSSDLIFQRSMTIRSAMARGARTAFEIFQVNACDEVAANVSEPSRRKVVTRLDRNRRAHCYIAMTSGR